MRLKEDWKNKVKWLFFMMRNVTINIKPAIITWIYYSFNKKSQKKKDLEKTPSPFSYSGLNLIRIPLSFPPNKRTHE